jgi:hypothetical protein
MRLGKDLDDHNRKFSDACAEACAWATEQLRARGHNSVVTEHAVFTSKKDGQHEESTSIKITVDYQRYFREAKGICVRVHRQRHPVLYRRETMEWKTFPWEKIFAAHLEELENVIKRAAEYANQRSTQTRMNQLAKEEVWLPEMRFGVFGETVLNGTNVEFVRRRNGDGTYNVVLRGTYTLKETLQLRDIAIAAHNRSEGGKSSVVPDNENTAKAAS